ncbi:CPCC family cysteine-rich protein [Streptomyces sp. NBC_00199]|uniref:CPCC family cysteine-rich protein n=1 Tax=Streptomyces sp. NBC_00199 TaxID=2975678 RepID=UPI002258C30F|nr:CPCC family cysteine-rich protein [Streptomyces sp. NBC_00199]MCX5267224.1 CPCC family cysteine-rich protein [Streptomyces sp. NBC_00199]
MVTPFVNNRGKPEDGPYPCPCCGFLTLEERSCFEICPVCFWEDDGQGDDNADRVLGGPNGRLSLTEARNNFRVLGASDERRLTFVRAPLEGEYPAV